MAVVREPSFPVRHGKGNIRLTVSGNVLARTQSMQRLRLRTVLDVKQWIEDMNSLGGLTDLRVVSVKVKASRFLA
jgi:hypothetical protein